MEVQTHSFERFQIELAPLGSLATLSTQWKSLENEANCSFFLTWGWIGPWLDACKEKLPMRVLRVKHEEKLVALAIFSEETLKRAKAIPFKAWIMNSSLSNHCNMIIEHNGLLVIQEYARAVYSVFHQYFSNYQQDVDEVVIPYINQETLLIDEKLPLNLWLEETDCYTSPYVDIEQFKKKNHDYLNSLSRNTRYQIRKTIKLYQSIGEISIIQASSKIEHWHYFEELKALHQAYWVKKGKQGSFANTIWEEFHKSVILNNWETNKIQLLKISVGDQVIGVIYSFVHNRQVNMIQTGFNYDLLPNAKPGYLCHYLAILHNIKLGMAKYDFLAGDAQYKKSLSNQLTQQIVYRISKKNVKWKIERFVKRIYSYFQ